GKELYTKLQQDKQLQHVKLRFVDYAYLDAISVVLGLARVGDLELSVRLLPSRVIKEDECLASMHRQDVFLKHTLLRELLMEGEQEPPPDPPALDITPQSVRQRIIAELQWRIGMTAREMALIIVERERLEVGHEDAIFELVKQQASALFKEGHVFATAQDDDIFLQFRKRVTP
ncbi:MAG: hypothetical protein AAFV29_27835, partial [Myxococcota bacterium]